MLETSDLKGAYNGKRYIAHKAHTNRTTMQHYNIIGDVHGRDCWQQLVKDDCVNIFVGDYFDPYTTIPGDRLLQNFEAIVAFKRAHPETVLLYGNHDMHYMTNCVQSSRHDDAYADTYRQAFAAADGLFYGVAYAADDHTLVTHAGVTREWYERHFGPYRGESPQQVAEQINALWERDMLAFQFDMGNFYDFDGSSPTQSPVWIRPWTLQEHDLFEGTPYRQIFGHTQMEDITTIGNLICVDCLGTTPKSFES